tara:strand:- start:292 stop:510 length:219 start_codon:yes stop_codon:yes gene_type:complete
MKRKKRKRKYYVHPIDALDPGLDKNEIKDRKWNDRTLTIYMLFLIIVCLLIPLFEIISDLFKYGLYKNIDGI